MNCPITYNPIEGSGKYSPEGLKLLSRQLKTLEDLPYSAEEQRQEAVARASKMSIQGVQPKLSAMLDTKRQSFVIVDVGGEYILKPQSHLYSELPENEDLTMRLASVVGVEIPIHGLIYSKDGSFTYFIKRFDRQRNKQKLAVEDFAQLLQKTRDTKYDSSMEQIIQVIERFCTFPMVEKLKLFKLTLVNYLLGNEDMHLKNFSLIRSKGKVELSPAYDLINTTIALKNPIEELALPLAGKKRNLTKKIFLEYFAIERLLLQQKVINQALEVIIDKFPLWDDLINRSFLSDKYKKKFQQVLSERREILGL
jgi:serine/threonine-protein kinase HipA